MIRSVADEADRITRGGRGIHQPPAARQVQDVVVLRWNLERWRGREGHEIHAASSGLVDRDLLHQLEVRFDRHVARRSNDAEATLGALGTLGPPGELDVAPIPDRVLQ